MNTKLQLAEIYNKLAHGLNWVPSGCKVWEIMTEAMVSLEQIIKEV